MQERKTVQHMKTVLQGIANKSGTAKPGYKFGGLYRLLNEVNLKQCFFELRKDAAVGVDNVSYREYKANLHENVESLVKRLCNKGYHAQNVRRKYIPKGGGKLRPLGIPAIEEKMLQKLVSKILEAIFEGEFLDSSYGYRPKVGAKDAVKEITRKLHFGNFGYVVEADIKGFFDNLDHEWMLRMLEERINDRPFIKLINKWLKAGILEEDGNIINPITGTPQGGIVSPVLANVYLHFALDIWFEKIIKPKCEGTAMMARYADDFICTFQYDRDAKVFYNILADRLKKFNLEVAPEKTKIIRFTRQDTSGKSRFDFLGFEFSWGLSRKGKPFVKKRTSRKKLRGSIASFKEWIKVNRHKRITALMKTLGRKLRGYYNYYGVIGNSESLKSFYKSATDLLFKWLNRRSQRKSYNWKGFLEMIKYFQIPRPRIMERGPTSQLSFL